jgi:hypothetical protein
MSAKKRKSKDAPRERGGKIDRGAVAGGLASCLVLIAWAFVQLSDDASADSAGQEKPTRPPTPSTVPNQDNPSVPVAPPVVEPAYKQDIRDAITLGKEGLADFQEALDWREKVGGDPFKFANMAKESGAKVTRAVTALEALRKDAKGDSAAIKNIDEWVDYFDKKMPSNRK